MREILFRAKRKDNKKWIAGYYAIIGERNVIIKSQSEDYYAVDDSVKKSHGNEVIEVNPETVCQYTGLADKNDRKIFEGDILRSDDNKIGQVQWFEDHSAFMIWNNTENKVHFLYDNDFSKIEVIGNIFDNPELIGDQP